MREMHQRQTARLVPARASLADVATVSGGYTLSDVDVTPKRNAAALAVQTVLLKPWDVSHTEEGTHNLRKRRATCPTPTYASKTARQLHSSKESLLVRANAPRVTLEQRSPRNSFCARRLGSAVESSTTARHTQAVDVDVEFMDSGLRVHMDLGTRVHGKCPPCHRRSLW